MTDRADGAAAAAALGDLESSAPDKGRVLRSHGSAVMVALTIAALTYWPGVAGTLQWPAGVRAACLGQALVFALAVPVALRGWWALSTAWSCLLATLAIGLAAHWSSPAFAASLMGLLAVLACVAANYSSPRASLLVVVVAVLVILAQAAVGGGVVAATMHLLLLAAGRLLGLALAGERARQVAVVQGREDRYQDLLHIAADGYWELDQDLRFIAVSEIQSGLLPAIGMFLGQRPWELGADPERPGTEAAIRQTLESRRPFRNLLLAWQGQGRQGASDTVGSWRHFSLNGAPVDDSAGRLVGYRGTLREITAEVLGERALRDSEARYRQLFARSPSPMLLLRRGVVLDVNVATARLLGLSDPAEIRGRLVVDLFFDAADAHAARERSRQIELAEPSPDALPLVEYRLRGLGDKVITVEATGMRVELDGGPATLSILIDTTLQKSALAAVQRSERLLSDVLHTSPDIITLAELHSGRFVMVNDSFQRLVGFSRDEVLGHTPSELGLWASDADRQRVRDGVVTGQRVLDMPVSVCTRSGHQVEMRVSFAVFAEGERQYLVVNARDVSESERARLEREAILAHASIGIAFTRQGQLVHANARFASMFGIAAEQLQAAFADARSQLVWPSDPTPEPMDQLAAPMLAGETEIDVERHMRRHDGSLFWCRLRAAVVDRERPLERGIIWLAEDVTERHETAQALAAARDAAEQASRAKSRFLANMSHEIRTPLAGLIGLARLAGQSDRPERDRAHFLSLMQDSASGLEQLIADVLDLSKIEAGKIDVACVDFDLAELVESVVGAYRALARAKGLTLDLSGLAALPRSVSGDAVRLRQILGNYLSNALKFTDQGGVQVQIEPAAGDQVLFSVIDSGPGLDPASLKLLFQPFSQVDDSSTRRYGGTGLGLSICRELAQLLGGEVGASSRSGEGSCFWVRLPLPATNPAALPEPDASSTVEQAVLQGARVLVVEDNAVNRLIATATLQQWQVQVVQAQDGHEALEMFDAARAAGQPVDLVLMDVHMPVLSGYETTRLLRRRPGGARLPIVALTAGVLVSEREEALACGMNAFLTKPVVPDELRQVLAEQLVASLPGSAHSKLH